MMRPTTASASKTHEKAATPPKVSRPVTRNAHARKGESHGSPAAPKVKPVAAQKEEKQKHEAEEEEAKANAGLIEQPEPAAPAAPAEPEIVVPKAEPVEASTEERALAEPEIVVPKAEPVEASTEERAAAEHEMPESMLVEVIEAPSTDEAAASAANVAALSPAVLETEKEGLLGEPVGVLQEEPVLSDRIDVAAIMEEDERMEEEAEVEAKVEAERSEEKGAEPTISAKISEEKEEKPEQEAKISEKQQQEEESKADQAFMSHEPFQALAFDAAKAGFEIPVEDGISEACLVVGTSDKPQEMQIEDAVADVEGTALAS